MGSGDEKISGDVTLVDDGATRTFVKPGAFRDEATTAPIARELAAGMTIQSRYRLDRRLGEGGLGVVWAARDEVQDRNVALKFLKSLGDEDVRRFEREARVTAALCHPHIVKVSDIFTLASGTPVMVMDLLDGESLAARLRRGRLDVAEAARVFLPVVEAVEAAHAALIVHRDLKPDNVFLSSKGVRVLDFGIAKLTETSESVAIDAQITRSGHVLGTPHYMSPEQMYGDKTIDGRTDTWAIGVMLYEALAGRKPIEGNALGSVFRAIASGTFVPVEQYAPVPAELAALVAAMMQIDREARPPLRAVHDVLSRALTI
ncbi:MAG: Protein kinase [Myxococcaceae bacterium]|nr:Protein kinase [Myxococcaceae bacterium]